MEKRRVGRPRLPGKLYRFSYRFRPGLDPPELQELLEAIEQAQGSRRAEILRAALVGGVADGKQAGQGEGGEATEMLDDLFGNF